MAIRIRKVKQPSGKTITVALCAAETDPKRGDLYLDDNIHHALSTKFGVDWKSSGFLDDSMADPVLLEVMLGEKLRDAKTELEKWLRRRKSTPKRQRKHS